MQQLNVSPRKTGSVTLALIDVRRGSEPAPVHLVFRDPVSGDFDTELCLSFNEAYELRKTLERVLDDIAADGCGWQVHSP